MPVTGERRCAGARFSPGRRGHGLPEWRYPAGPGGWVAPGLCAAPEIPALGGGVPGCGLSQRAPPSMPVGTWGGGGGGRREGGGGRLGEEVLGVLVDVELLA